MMQLRFRRPGHDPEQLGDLLVPVSLEVVQHEHLSCPVGEPAHRLLEIHRDLGRRRRAGGRLQRTLRVVVAPALAAERRPPREDYVHREAVEPGPEGSFAPEGRELGPGADEHVLRYVVRCV